MALVNTTFNNEINISFFIITKSNEKRRANLSYICCVRTKTSIHALIKLMSDTDEMVRNHAKSTLMDYGVEIIPELEILEDDSIFNPEFRSSIIEVLGDLRLSRIKKGLKKWINSSNKNLVDALYLIDSYQFPDLTRGEFDQKIEEIRHRCWLKINLRNTSFEKVSILNSIFFEEFGYAGVEKLPHSPFEVFISSTIDSKEGTALSLGLIYSLVAQDIGLPIYGVTTLNNRAPFVLAYLDKNRVLSSLNWEIDGNGVLFYISLDDQGAIVEPSRLKKIYEEKALPLDKSQFEPSPNTLVVKKYLNEVFKSYANQPHYRYKLNDIEQLIELF